MFVFFVVSDCACSCFMESIGPFGLVSAIIATFLCQERLLLRELACKKAGKNESSLGLLSSVFAWSCFLLFHHEPACGYVPF